jgi:hypothetical protein
MLSCGVQQPRVRHFIKPNRVESGSRHLCEIRRERTRPAAGKWPVSDRAHPHALAPGAEKFSVRLPSLRVFSGCHGVTLEAAHGIPNPKSTVESWFFFGKTVHRRWQSSSDFTRFTTSTQAQSQNT